MENKGKIKNYSYILLFAIITIIYTISCKHGAVEKGPFLKQDLNALDGTNGKIVKLEQIEVSKYAGRVECHRAQYLSDGLKVVGFILKPKTEGRFPVMIYNRGGNREYGKITTKTLNYLAYLSSCSYVVLASQYRGNDGGQGYEQFGGKDVDDVLNLIPLARSLPFTDPNRIVMLGFSRGGMMTYLAIKQGAEIKAAAVVGGITDLIQTYREREEGMKKVIEELVGFSKKEYKERSAYYWPEKIDVPVLILHGEDDWRVKASQAKKLAEKLKELGKPHELFIVPKGDHGLNTHRSQRNNYILSWFDKYLK